MASPHRCVALMAALAAAALLLTLDAPVVSARLRSPPGTVADGVFEKSYDVGTVLFSMTEAARLNTLKVLQAFAAAIPSLGWSGDDFCSWSGVTCLGDNVSIILSRSWVTGTLPEIPDDVDYSMVPLDHISIFGQDSGITGTLPDSWGKLRKVRTVSLGYMSISGTLPVSWASMRSLSVLRLRSVNVSGTLPAAWSSMEAMEEIMIFNTGITGTLPEAWSTMPNLARIYLERCKLYGSLPESWALMPSLGHLSLRNNNLCGCVPETWLTSPTLFLSVDTKHLLRNCTTEEACVEVSTTRRRAQYDPRCEVPHCILCLPRDSKLCGVCVDGYVLTDDWQCMKGPEWETALLAMSESERWNTLKVLQAFAAAMPSLGWSGGDFCSWSGVTCSGGNVSVILARSWVTGTLPEMPEDVDYSTVRLDQIHLFGQDSGILGTLPSSWGKLRNVRIINLAYTGISGTLPASWSSMEAIEQIIISNTQISGNLPEAWSALPNLQRIHLQGCNLHGSLPESWARMPSLERLDLRKNKFCGCVPQLWLLAGSLSVDVDRRHNLPHCLQAEGCDETTTPEPIGNSMSSTSWVELTTLSPTSDHQCSVPNCISCFPRNWKLCGVCIDGYVLTDDWQCVKSLDLGTVPITMSEAERVNTLRVLQAFAAAMPSLGWSGDDFCSWSYVTCFDTNVSLIITSLRETGTLPEMPDDVDYSMVRLDQIHLFGQDSGITGTLPSSWGKLRRVRTINLAYTGIIGTLPAAWCSMEAVEEIVLSNTEISGTLPEAWGMMKKLWKVYLEGCNLYGSFPESWVEMPSVERVSLHKNHFCGCLPQSWLTSPIFRVAVDVKHRTANCSTAEACNEMRMSQPVASTFTIMTAEPSTPPVTVTTDRASAASASAATKPSTDNKAMGVPPAPAAVQCSVSMCAWCVPGNMGRCGVCSYGHVLTVDGQCIPSPDSMEPKRFTRSEAERLNTLKVLQAFAAAMPSLGWSGDNFCSWSGVRCWGDNVSIILARSGVTGTLPEMPDDVDYSMVKLNEIKFFGANRGITGTLPSSWSKLRKLRALRLGYTGMSGTLPAAWSSMEAIEQIIVWDTQITGTLPEAWSALPNIRRIHFQQCSLYGSFPESWARIASLERLGLRNNHFCGCVPQSWLRSITLLIGVDARHRMANCATAEACSEMGGMQRITSTSSTTTTAASTTPLPTTTTTTRVPPTTSEPQCKLFKLKRCPLEAEKWCMVCASPQMLMRAWQRL